MAIRMTSNRLVNALAGLLLGFVCVVPVQADPSKDPTADDPVCDQHPGVCPALRDAIAALGKAAKADRASTKACTITPDKTECGGTVVKYPLQGSAVPPMDLERGQQLLKWYLQNYKCENVCAVYSNPAQCQLSCEKGEMPSK